MANKITNEISTVFTGDTKKLEASVKNAEKQMGRFKKQVDKTNGTSGGGGKGASSGGSGMQGMLATAGRLVPALSAAFAIREITRFGIEAVRLGATLDGVASTFRQIELSGATSLSELRNVTRGAVDDLNLMSAAVQAKNFKVPLEDLGSFFEFATIRAAQTGESVEYLTNSIVLGIGRKSPLILDNLGITLVRLKEAMGKVGRESATVADISAGVSKIAKEETDLLKKLGLTAETTAQKIAKLSANFKNFQTSVGQDVAEGNIFSFITDKISEIQDFFRTARTMDNLSEKLGMSEFEKDTAFRDFAERLGDDVSFAEKKILFSEKLLKRVNSRFEGYVSKFKTLAGELKEGETYGEFEARVIDIGIKLIDETPEHAKGDMKIAVKKALKDVEASLNDVALKEKTLSEKRADFFEKYLKGLAEIASAENRGYKTLKEAASERVKLLEGFNVAVDVSPDESALKGDKRYNALNLQLAKSVELLDGLEKKTKDVSDIVAEEIAKMAVPKETLEGGAYLDISKNLILPDPEEFSQATQLGMQWANTLDIINRKVADGYITQSEADKQRLDGLRSYIESLYDAQIAVDEFLLNGLEGLEDNPLTDETRIGNIASAWNSVSNALNQVANNIPDGSGLQSTIKTVVTLAGAIAAAASVAAALQVILGDKTAPGQGLKAAAAVFTGLAGVIGAVASLGGGGGSSVSGYNGSLQDRAELYTTIRGSDLQLVLSRNGQMSGRRG